MYIEKHKTYLGEIEASQNSFIFFIVTVAILISVNTYQRTLSEDSLTMQVAEYIKKTYLWFLFG